MNMAKKKIIMGETYLFNCQSIICILNVSMKISYNTWNMYFVKILSSCVFSSMCHICFAIYFFSVTFELFILPPLIRTSLHNFYINETIISTNKSRFSRFCWGQNCLQQANINLKKVRSHHFLSVIYLLLIFSHVNSVNICYCFFALFSPQDFFTEQNGPCWFFCSVSPNQITLLKWWLLNKDWKLRGTLLIQCKCHSFRWLPSLGSDILIVFDLKIKWLWDCLIPQEWQMCSHQFHIQGRRVSKLYLPNSMPPVYHLLPCLQLWAPENSSSSRKKCRIQLDDIITKSD